MLLKCIVHSWNHLKLIKGARFIKYRDLSMSKNLDVIVSIWLIISFTSLISFISIITAKIWRNTYTVFEYNINSLFFVIEVLHCKDLLLSLWISLLISIPTTYNWLLIFKIAAITWRKKRVKTASEFGVEFWNLYWCDCILVCIFCLQYLYTFLFGFTFLQWTMKNFLFFYFFILTFSIHNCI